MHKSVKTLARLSFSPAEVGEQERAKTCQVFCTVITMLAGALLGTTCLFLNPFAWDYDFDGDDDTWLFVPVAITLLSVLCVLGRASALAGGWPKALIEPLVPSTELQPCSGQRSESLPSRRPLSRTVRRVLPHRSTDFSGARAGVREVRHRPIDFERPVVVRSQARVDRRASGGGPRANFRLPRSLTLTQAAGRSLWV